MYTVTWYFLYRCHFLTLDLIGSADVAHLRWEQIIMFSLFDQWQCRKQNRKKKNKKKNPTQNKTKTKTQQTHEGHAHKPQRMFTLKQKAKCCKCLSLIDEFTYCVSPECVLNGTHYTPPSSLTHTHNSTPRVYKKQKNKKKKKKKKKREGRSNNDLVGSAQS